MRPRNKPYTRTQLLLLYSKDWVLVFVLIGMFLAIDSIGPFNRRFSLNDPTIQFPYAEHEHVPPRLLVVIALVAPFAIMSSVAIFMKGSFLDWHNATLGLLLSLALTIMVTDVIKVTVGRPRPDFIDRCKPINGSHDAPVTGLSTSDICTWTDDHIKKDGYKSFPSGHSSTSFCGMAFLSTYLAGKLHVFDTGGGGRAYKSFVVTVPYIAAALVAITRTEDYRHHWQDVTVGGILGTVFAFFAYLQYYPPPWSEEPHIPYNHRLFLEDHANGGDESPGDAELLPPDDDVV